MAYRQPICFAGGYFESMKDRVTIGTKSSNLVLNLNRSIWANPAHKKSGPCNADLPQAHAYRWKGAPVAHYRLYPLVLLYDIDRKGLKNSYKIYFVHIIFGCL